MRCLARLLSKPTISYTLRYILGPVYGQVDNSTVPACRQAGSGSQNSSMHWVYAIYLNKGKRIYVGMSEDVKKRLAQHNAGQVFSTKATDHGI